MGYESTNTYTRCQCKTPHSLLRSEALRMAVIDGRCPFPLLDVFSPRLATGKAFNMLQPRRELTHLFVFEQPPIKHQRLGFPPLRDALHIHLNQGELELEGGLSFERYRRHVFLRLFFHAVSVIIRRRCIFLLLHFLVLLNEPICGAVNAIHSYTVSIAVDGAVDQTVL